MFHADESGKRQKAEEIELPNQESFRMLGEKENYKYMEILEVVTIKQVEMKGEKKKEYYRQMRKLLEIKSCNRNLIKCINT